MIYTASDNLADVKAMGQKLKVAVNKKYKLLEIEMDGFFRRMLLLKKKKYAALTAIEADHGKVQFSRETKGLDLVRRDWCELSHDVSE
jgi:DNA polymerase alpha subunit A